MTKEEIEDEIFKIEYTKAYDNYDLRHIAGILSVRLAQMDKRAKAANIRADKAETELKALKARL